MELNNRDLIQLAVDTALGTIQSGEFSAKDSSEMIRETMVELFGTDHIDYKTFRRHQTEIFEFIEETVVPATHKKLEATFAQFADFRSIPYGDQNLFKVPNTELFPVAAIAEGDGNIRRKRLEGSEYTIELSNIAVGIYEELVRFMAGRVDWAMYVQKLVDSFERDIAQRISAALYGSFDALGSTYAASVGATDDDMKEKVLSIAAHVEAEHGEVVLVGTKAALAKLKPEYHSDGQAGDRNNKGYFAIVDGYEALAMTQFHKSGTDEFALDTNTILILPTPNEKIVKVVLEGDAMVREMSGSETEREDMQVRYDVIMRAGVLVLTSRKYGIVKFV